jgi:LAGLIDADG DNA endonuclease family
LYELFKGYSTTAPISSNLPLDKRTGKVYSRIRFNTYSLPCFNVFHDLFYREGLKIVPLNIAELLTPLGLAYWIADDGSWDKSKRHVVLCTNSFTLAEVNLLISVLNKWNLKCYKTLTYSGYVIIIPAYSVPVLQNLVATHMPTMMRHKIGLT